LYKIKYLLGWQESFFRFFSSKISIFYKISMTPFDRAKFQLSVLQIMVIITMIFNGVMSNQNQNSFVLNFLANPINILRCGY